MKFYFSLFYFLFLSVHLSSQDVVISVVEANGANTGSITAAISNPQFHYNYEWFDINGNQILPQPACNNGNSFSCTLSNLNPGRYCVKIISSGSECDPNTPVTVEGCADVTGTNCDSDLSFSIDVSASACPNDDSGFMTLNIDSEISDPCWTNGSGNVSIEWENGNTENTIENLEPSKKCAYIYADQSGSCENCYAWVCGQIESLTNTPLIIDATIENPVCVNNGIINLSISGGTGNYSTTWISGNLTGNFIENLSTGVYCVIVEDECNSQLFQCFELIDSECDNECPEEIPTFINQVSRCSPNNTTSVLFLLDQNVHSRYDLPYTLKLTNLGSGFFESQTITNLETSVLGRKTFIIENVIAGEFEVEIVFSENCTSIFTIEVTDFFYPSDPPACEVIGDVQRNVSGCSDVVASILVDMDCSLPNFGPWDYRWNDNVNSKDRLNVGAGLYCVTATANNGCEFSKCFNIKENQSTCNILGIVTDSEVCPNTGSIEINVNCQTGTNSPFIYNWSDNNSTDKNRYNLEPGFYCVTVTDNANCDYSRCFTVSEFLSDFQVNLTRDCGNIFEVEILGDCFPYGLTYTNLVVNSQNVPVNAPGPHVIIDQNPFFLDMGTSTTDGEIFFEVSPLDGNAPTLFLSAILNDYPLNVTIGTEQFAICIENEISLNLQSNVAGGTEPYNYAWSNNDEESIITVDQSGEYCLTVTDDCGHKSTACYEVNCREDVLDPFFSCIPNNFGIDIDKDCPCIDDCGWNDWDGSDIDAHPDWDLILGTLTITWPDGSITRYINNNGQKLIIGETEYDIEVSGNYPVSVHADWLDQEVTCSYGFQQEFTYCGPILWDQIDPILSLNSNSLVSLGCYSCRTCGNTPEEIDLFNSVYNFTTNRCEESSLTLMGFIPDKPDDPCGEGTLRYSCACSSDTYIEVRVLKNTNAQYLPISNLSSLFNSWNVNDVDYNLICPESEGFCIFENWQIPSMEYISTADGINNFAAIVCPPEDEEEPPPPPPEQELCLGAGNVIFLPTDPDNPCWYRYFCSESPDDIFEIELAISNCITELNKDECYLSIYCEESCLIDEVIPIDCSLLNTTINCFDVTDCNLRSLDNGNIDNPNSVNSDNPYHFVKSLYKIYPNPANEFLFLERLENSYQSNEIEKVYIHSIDGILYSSFDITNKGISKVDITSYPAGLYVLTVSSKQYINQFKFVKND